MFNKKKLATDRGPYGLNVKARFMRQIIVL